MCVHRRYQLTCYRNASVSSSQAFGRSWVPLFWPWSFLWKQKVGEWKTNKINERRRRRKSYRVLGHPTLGEANNDHFCPLPLQSSPKSRQHEIKFGLGSAAAALFFILNAARQYSTWEASSAFQNNDNLAVWLQESAELTSGAGGTFPCRFNFMRNNWKWRIVFRFLLLVCLQMHSLPFLSLYAAVSINTRSRIDLASD